MDKLERGNYLREWRRQRRESALPADRRCPACGEVKTKSRSWVVLLHVHRAALRRLNSPEAKRALLGRAVCRQCAMGPLRPAMWS